MPTLMADADNRLVERRRRARRDAVILGLVAAGFLLAFFIATLVRG